MLQMQVSLPQMKTSDAPNVHSHASDADPLDSEAASFNFDPHSNASDAEPASNADIPKWGLAVYRLFFHLFWYVFPRDGLHAMLKSTYGQLKQTWGQLGAILGQRGANLGLM